MVSPVTVRRLVAEIKLSLQDPLARVYLPLRYDPGHDGQVDFFEAVVEDESGVQSKAFVLLVRACFSGRTFAYAAPNQTREALLDDGSVRETAAGHCLGRDLTDLLAVRPRELLFDGVEAGEEIPYGLESLGDIRVGRLGDEVVHRFERALLAGAQLQAAALDLVEEAVGIISGWLAREEIEGDGSQTEHVHAGIGGFWKLAQLWRQVDRGSLLLVGLGMQGGCDAAGQGRVGAGAAASALVHDPDAGSASVFAHHHEDTLLAQ